VFFDWLAAWPNVPFTIALGATLLFALAQASGLLGLFAGGDAHGDADGHAGAGGDVDADVDAHADVDGDADADVDADGETHASIGAALLSPLGIGRVPITLTAQVAGIAFATTGLALNTPWLEEAAQMPLRSLAWTLPAGLLAAYGTAALVARLLAPIVDDKRHVATSRQQMVGALGTVISSRVTEEFGEIRVRDRSGHDVRLICRLAPGVGEIAERDEVVIVEIDERGVVFVAPLDALAARSAVERAEAPETELSAAKEPSPESVARDAARSKERR